MAPALLRLTGLQLTQKRCHRQQQQQDMICSWNGSCVTDDIGGLSLSGEREQWIHEHMLACLG